MARPTSQIKKEKRPTNFMLCGGIKPMMGAPRQCIIPKDSVIIKEGELLKIGQNTGTMRTRYYILRDNALYIYRSKDQKVPTNIIALRGLFVSAVQPTKGNNYYGFMLSHESDAVRSRTYYHKTHEAI